MQPIKNTSPLLSSLVLLFMACFNCSVSQPDLDEPDLQLLQLNNWQMANEILQHINTHRHSLGKAELLKDSLYASAHAIQHSLNMIASKTVNHHGFFKRSAALKNRGALKVSENVAYGYYNAQSFVNAWLRSQPHRNNLEDDFTHLGFGVLKDLNNAYYVTLLFYK